MLTAAGHDTVRRPACLRCGAQKPLPNLVDGGRVCNRCAYQARRALCADCERERPVSARDEQGRPLCDSCRRYSRYETCSGCNVKSRVSRRTAEGAPLCRQCDRTQFRTCCRCGQPAPTYANTPDGPTCKACYQRPRRRCGACGEVRRIDLTATATHPDLCSRCRTRQRRACLICGELHPAHPLAHQPVCLSCRDKGHILEPDLIEVNRTRRRRHETAHDVVRQRLEKILTHPDHGIAEQLAPLIDAYQQVRKPDHVMQWLNTPQPGTVLLAELAIRAHSEPVTHDLLDSYPQTYTLHRLRDLFVYAGILPARAELLERIQPWLDQVLSDRPPHHATLVRPFATWHALRRARQRARRRPTTASSATYVRSQVTIALNFLSWLDGRGQTLTTANQSDLDLWLKEGTQTNYFLATFIAWANARGLCELTIPHRPRSEPANFLEEDDRWNMLRRCLHDQNMPIDVRAAGTLILLFGRTTTTFTNLTVADLQQVSGETYLRLGDFTALLPPPAAAVFHTLSVGATTKETFQQPDNTAQYLFPGRFPGRPAAAQTSSAANSAPTASPPCRPGTQPEPAGPATFPAPSPPTYSESTSAPPPNGPAARVVTGPTTSPNAPKHWSEMTANAGTEGSNTAPCKYQHVTSRRPPRPRRRRRCRRGRCGPTPRTGRCSPTGAAVTGSRELPADPDTVARFLGDCPAAPATLRRRVAAIDHHHTAAGHPRPGESAAVRAALGRPVILADPAPRG